MIETRQTTSAPGVIDLGIGQPQLDLLPSRQLAAAAARALDGSDNASLNYGPARGNGYFLLALANLLQAGYGVPVSAESLLATGGCSAALAMLAGTLARPGDTVLVEDPTYFLAHRIFHDASLRVVGVPLGPQGLEPDRLAAAITEHRPKLLYTIPVHQNPSGLTMSAEARRPIVELCERHRVTILADEVYQLLTYQGDPPPPMAAYLDSEAVVSLGSFSKILAPGLRLGWLQAAPSLLGKLTSLGVFASGGGTNHFAGCMVKEMLENGDQASYLEELRKLYRHRVELMARLLEQHLGDRVSFERPSGGYFFWLRLRDGRDAQALYSKAVQAGVGYRTGALFSASGAHRDHLRLSFAYYGDAELETAVERLATVI